jgi:hypothetical protein
VLVTAAQVQQTRRLELRKGVPDVGGPPDLFAHYIDMDDAPLIHED